MTRRVIRQSWTEFERGWGQKPWSHTLHLSREDMEQFNSAYWASMPDAVQDWYIAPDRNQSEVEVSEELYQTLLQQAQNLSGNEFKGKGIWHSGNIKAVLSE